MRKLVYAICFVVMTLAALAASPQRVATASIEEASNVRGGACYNFSVVANVCNYPYGVCDPPNYREGWASYYHVGGQNPYGNRTVGVQCPCSTSGGYVSVMSTAKCAVYP